MTTMPVATSNRTAMRYVKEVSLATPVVSPVLKTVRYTGESLALSQTFTASEEIRSDRNQGNTSKTSSSTAGDISVELSLDSFDDFLAAVMSNTWSAPVLDISTLKNGVIRDSFMFQKHFQDITTPIFQNFFGCLINKLSLDFQSGQIIKGSFAVIGTSTVTSTAQIAGATVTPALTTLPLNAVSDLQTVERNGVAMTSLIKKLSLAIENNVRALDAIGHAEAVDMALGQFSVSGSMDIYLSDKALYDDYVAGTPFSFSFKLVDPSGDYYRIILPNAKFETGQIVSGGSNQDVMMTGTWRALYDETELCSIIIEKYVAP